MRRHVGIVTVFLLGSLAAQAQWLNNKDPKAPRLADGTANLKGPVPMLNGKPDLSGVWQVGGDPQRGLFGLGESPNHKYFRSILSDFKPNEQPLTALGAEMFKKNQAGTGTKNPQLYCLPDGVPHGILLPEPFKIVPAANEVLFLYEVETIFRQIYTDGRKLPEDPRPTWLGYSVGRWDGDTFVIETLGFNDLGWLDAGGHGHSEDMKVEERFRRVDYGHMEVNITLTDPKVFTQPIKLDFTENLMPDTDVFEHICNEDEKDAGHQPGRPPAPAAQ